ncbi:hypothetical protein TRFO_33000 [Tritrichomonas foetus]|uniref:Protein kinase domain-containing protein n=1 Tax=Tritrichomonas foetus TaxID=1144522 RepID=A0A1J4JMQ7_9EUKA|nr:hypothetical protein TRFO_33000 [Tritrichomonas foetus]|eukprot:OHT00355.1 hypothetical protein TRFO_33000 [Tritrichomonas foetus]
MRDIHPDLKIENILLDSEKHVKTCVFDISTLSLNNQINNNSGTYGYISPEQILNQESTFKIDVYSFGILLYYIIMKGNNIPNPISQVFRNIEIKITQKSLISQKYYFSMFIFKP